MELLLSNLGTLFVGSVVFVGICFAARSVRKEFESGGLQRLQWVQQKLRRQLWISKAINIEKMKD